MAMAIEVAHRRGWMTLASSRNQVDKFSQLAAKPAYPEDLEVVKRLEGLGLTFHQAKSFNSAITEVLKNASESNAHTQMSEKARDAKIFSFMSEMQSLQERQFSLLQHETEKLKKDIKMMCFKLRNEVDKTISSECSCINAERGYLRKEIVNQFAKTSNLSNILEQEIHASRIQLRDAKYDVTKYCVGPLLLVVTVGLAIILH